MAVRRSVVVSLVIAGTFLAGSGAVAATQVPRLYEEYVLDNRSHGWDCKELPSEQDLNDLFFRNSALVQAIRDVDRDHVVVSVGEDERCPGRYSILIAYASHAQRKQIEVLIEGTPLANAPINWRNV